MKKMIKALTVGVIAVSMMFTNTVSVFADETTPTESGTVSVQYEDGRKIKTLDIVDGKVKAPGEFGLNLEKREDTKFQGWILNDETEFRQPYSTVDVQDGDILKTHYITKLSDFRLTTKGFKASGATLTGGPENINVAGKHNGEFRDEVRRFFDQLYSGHYTVAVEGLPEGLESDISVYENTGSLKVTDKRYVDGEYLFDFDFKAADTGSMLSMDISFSKNSVTLKNDDGTIIKEMEIVDGKVTLPYDFNIDLEKDDHTFVGWILNNDDSKIYRGYNVVDVNKGDTFTAVWEQNSNSLQIFDNTSSISAINIKSKTIDVDATSSVSGPSYRRWDVKDITRDNYIITVTGLQENDRVSLKQKAPYGNMIFNSIDFVDGVHIIDVDLIPEKGAGVFLSMNLDVTPSVTLKNDDGSVIQSMEIENGNVKLPYDFNIGLEKDDHEFVGWILNDDDTKVYSGYSDVVVTNGDVFTAVWRERVNDLQVFDNTDQITSISLKGNGLELDATSNTSGPSYRRWDLKGIKRGEYTMTLKGLNESSVLNIEKRSSNGDMTFKNIEFIDGAHVVTVDLVPEKGNGVFLSMDIDIIPTVSLKNDDGSLIKSMEIENGKVTLPYDFNIDLEKEDHEFVGWTLNDDTSKIYYGYQEVSVEDGDVFTAVWRVRTNDLQIFDNTHKITAINIKGKDINIDATSNVTGPSNRRWDVKGIERGEYVMTLKGLDGSQNLDLKQRAPYGDMTFKSIEYIDDAFVVTVDFVPEKGGGVFLSMYVDEVAKEFVDFIYEDGSLIETKEIIDGKVFVPYSWNFDLKDIEDMHFDGWLLNDGEDYISENKDIDVVDGDVFKAVYVDNTNELQFDVPRTVTNVNLTNSDGTLDVDMHSDTSFPNSKRYKLDNLTSDVYTLTVSGLNRNHLINPLATGGSSDVTVISSEFVNDDYVLVLDIKMTENTYDFLRFELESLAQFDVEFDLGKYGTSEDDLKSIVAEGYQLDAVPSIHVRDGFKLLGYSLDGTTLINPLDVTIEEDTTFIALYEAGIGNFSMNDDTKLITDIVLINKDTDERIELLKEEHDAYNTFSFDRVASGDYLVEFYGLPTDAIIDFEEEQVVPVTRMMKNNPSNVKDITITMDPNDANAASNPTFSVSYIVNFDLGTNGTTTDTLETKVIHGKKVSVVPTVSAQEGYTLTGWSLNGKTVDPESVTVESALTFTAVYEKTEDIKPVTPTEKESENKDTPKTDVSKTYAIYILMIAAATIFIGLITKKTKRHQ